MPLETMLHSDILNLLVWNLFLLAGDQYSGIVIDSRSGVFNKSFMKEPDRTR